MPQISPTNAPVNFGGTTILGGADTGTTILSGMPDAPQGKGAYLIRSATGERVEIRGDLFRIGKERSFVDYCIADNTVISRSHAVIRVREGAYFLADTNSTNHTFADGAMLSPNVEMRLENGTKIRLGNEELVFYLY
jgi:pSer/pThr/pTyr-binding forkhead associated (FHA) protein